MQKIANLTAERIAELKHNASIERSRADNHLKNAFRFEEEAEKLTEELQSLQGPSLRNSCSTGMTGDRRHL